MSKTARHTSPAAARRLHALVVYDAVDGDTKQLAQAIVDGLDGDFDSVVADIRDIAPERAADFDLIVTGEPSLTFGLCRAQTDDVLEMAAEIIGMKEWLTHLPEAHDRQFCACFDTRTPSGVYGGDPASANSIRIMHELGYELLSRQTFRVDSIGGPLLAGELDRAKAWADSLAARIPPT